MPDKLHTLVLSNQKRVPMFKRKDSIEFDSGYYFRMISVCIAILLTGFFSYVLWEEAHKALPDSKKITGMILFIPLIWGLVVLMRNVFATDAKEKQVEDLFKSIREASKRAREKASNYNL